MTGPRPWSGPDGADLARFRELLREASGLELPEARRPDLQRAVARALTTTGLADADALYRHLLDHAGRPALEAFVGDITVGETHFFRNRPQFEALERHILPQIIDRRRGTRRLRLWSAACSSGEEPYSLAILLERLLPDRARWDVRILATDIDQAALERARQGRYGAWSFREVPTDVTAGFFVRHGTTLELAARIRDAVTFAHLNLADDGWPSAVTGTLDLDLVLCRNVLIYFGDELTRQVAAKLHGALGEGGWLLVAPAELSQDVFRRFAVCNLGGAVAYRKAAAPDRPRPAAAAQPARRPPPDPIEPTSRPEPRREGIDEAVAAWRSSQPQEALRRLEELAKADPTDGHAPLLAARIHLDRLELDRAEGWAGVACQRMPLSAPAHYLLGLALQEAGRLEDALAALRRCVFLDPGSVLGQVALAGLLARQGEPARASSALRAAAALLGDGEEAQLLPGGEGLTVGRVRDLIAAQLVQLEGQPEVAP